MKTSIDNAFLEILICPATRQGLRRLDEKGIEELNRRIAGGKVRMVDGSVLDQPVEEGLVTEDGTRVYRVQEGIPVLLVEEAVANDPDEKSTTTAAGP